MSQEHLPVQFQMDDLTLCPKSPEQDERNMLRQDSSEELSLGSHQNEEHITRDDTAEDYVSKGTCLSAISCQAHSKPAETVTEVADAPVQPQVSTVNVETEEDPCQGIRFNISETAVNRGTTPNYLQSEDQGMAPLMDTNCQSVDTDEKITKSGEIFEGNETLSKYAVTDSEDDEEFTFVQIGDGSRMSPTRVCEYYLPELQTSEAGALACKKERTSDVSRYDINLKKFSDSIKSENETENLKIETVKSKHRKGFFKKFKSDGTISSILSCCGSISRVTNILRKIKISKSVPSSLNEFSNFDTLGSQKYKIQSEEEMFQIKKPVLLTCRDKCLEGIGEVTETKSAIGIDAAKQELISTATDVEVVSVSLPSNIPHSPIESSEVFKVPVPLKVSGSSKHSVGTQVEIASPGTSKIQYPEISPLRSPRRPTYFNPVPRKSVYIFCPDSPSDILRPFRSLPNINRPPRKELKRSSMNFENKSCVKSLFTGEMELTTTPPKTPESLVSSINIEDIEKNFPISQSEITGKIEESKGKGSTDLKYSSEYSASKLFHLSNKSKLRKKLIFVSNECENTNAGPTFQESSSSSMDLSSNIGKLQVADSEKEPSLTTKMKSSPKRKHEDFDLNVSGSSNSSPKKVRLFEVDETSKEQKLTDSILPKDECLGEAGPSRLKSVSDPTNSTSLLETITDSGSSSISAGLQNLQASNKEPVVQLLEDERCDDELKSRRPMKRSQMVLPIAGDTTEIPIDAKRKKQY